MLATYIHDHVPLHVQGKLAIINLADFVFLANSPNFPAIRYYMGMCWITSIKNFSLISNVTTLTNKPYWTLASTVWRTLLEYLFHHLKSQQHHPYHHLLSSSHDHLSEKEYTHHEWRVTTARSIPFLRTRASSPMCSEVSIARYSISELPHNVWPALHILSDNTKP